MTPIEIVLDALTAHGCDPRRSGDGWSAKCPAHEDTNPSLSVKEAADGTVLLKDHAGCAVNIILAALPPLTFKDLFGSDSGTGKKMEIAVTYDYTTVEGELVFQVVRLVPKSFRQRRPDGEGGYLWNLTGSKHRPLYRLPEVIEAVRAGRHVFVVEGEKDVETLRSHGLVATCNAGGAGKWRREYDPYLYDGRIVVIGDNDDVGREHARSIGRDSGLELRTKSFVILELPDLPDHGDVTDWFNAGHTVEELKQLVSEADAKVPVDGGEHPRTGQVRDDESEAKRDVQLIPASAIRLERTTWLSAGRIPLGGVTLLVGQEGCGKTNIAGDTAARATRGNLPGDLHGKPISAVYGGCPFDCGFSVTVPLVAQAS